MKTQSANENRTGQLKPGSITAPAQLSSFPAAALNACARSAQGPYPYWRALNLNFPRTT